MVGRALCIRITPVGRGVRPTPSQVLIIIITLHISMIVSVPFFSHFLSISSKPELKLIHGIFLPTYLFRSNIDAPFSMRLVIALLMTRHLLRLQVLLQHVRRQPRLPYR